MSGRRITRDELADLVRDHEAFLRSRSRSGRNLELDDVDLRGVSLTGLGLAGCSLTGCDLRGVDLTGVVLYEARLSGSLFGGAVLHGADLGRTEMVEVSAQGADLRAASLVGTWAPRAEFRDANLSRTDLGHADLVSADLRGARFDEADLDRTWLSGSVLDPTSWETAFVGAAGSLLAQDGDLEVAGPGDRRPLSVDDFVATVNRNGARLVAERTYERRRREHDWRWGPLPAGTRTPSSDDAPREP